MIRRPEIKFLPITFCFCWVFGVLGAQKGPKMGSERPSADRFQAVSDTIEGSPLFRKMDTFRPRTDRSFCTTHRGKRTAEPLIALSMPSRPSRDWRSATLKTIVHHVQLVSWRPSTAFDDGAPKSPFLAPFGHLAHQKPNKNKK